jgi:hypothetical protein
MGYQVFSFYESTLILLLNARTIISFAGIVLLVVGNWSWNRSWELYRPPENPPTPTAGGDDYAALHDPQRPPRFNVVAACGWSLLAFSYLLDRRDWIAFDSSSDGSLLLSFALGLLLSVGLLQSWLIPQALLDGTMEEMQALYGSIFFLGLLADGVLNHYLDPDAPAWMGPVGSLCVAIAPYFLYKARRKGEMLHDIEEEGIDKEQGGVTIRTASTANPDANRPYLFNLGGPILVVGWFLWWVSMNCVYAIPDRLFLQMFFSSRSYVAFTGAALIVLVYWMVGYALEANVANNVKSAPAFGVASLFFGDASEIPVAMVGAWGIFGFAVFWPVPVGWIPYAVFPVLLAVGYSMAMQQTAGLREHDVDAVSRWARCVDVGLLVKILLIGCYGRGLAVALMLVGLVLSSYGSLTIHHDRKFGHMWLRQPDAAVSVGKPQVYSYGVLAYPLGMIVLAWGLSIHPY